MAQIVCQQGFSFGALLAFSDCANISGTDGWDMPPKSLMQEIVDRSVASTWEAAVPEWRLESIYFSDDHQTCLCGHYPIREICVIENARNGESTEVGNCCVNNFLGLESASLFASIKKVKVDEEASLNPTTIEWARSQRIISQWDRDFYLNIWRKRRLSEKQLAHKLRINVNVLAATTRPGPSG